MKELLLFNISSSPKDYDIVARSAIYLSRNLADTPFPWRSSLPQLAESRRRIMERVLECDPGFSFESMEDLPREALHLALERGYFAESVSANGAGAFALDHEASRSVLVNNREHACFGYHCFGIIQEENLDSLLSFEGSLDSTLPWAFNQTEGYIQTNPDETGSGLCLSCRVFIPGIVAAGIWDRVARGLVATGMHIAQASCEGSDIPVDSNGPESSWIDIVFKAEPGQTEYESFSTFQSSLNILCSTERKARLRQAESMPIQSVDTVFRALALLGAARLLDETEAHILLSRVRFAVLMGIIPGSNKEKTCLLLDKLDALSTKSAIKIANKYNTDGIEDILETQRRAESIRTALVDHFPSL